MTEIAETEFGHFYSCVKFNSKEGQFSCIFLFETTFLPIKQAQRAAGQDIFVLSPFYFQDHKQESSDKRLYHHFYSPTFKHIWTLGFVVCLACIHTVTNQEDADCNKFLILTFLHCVFSNVSSNGLLKHIRLLCCVCAQ